MAGICDMIAQNIAAQDEHIRVMTERFALVDAILGHCAMMNYMYFHSDYQPDADDLAKYAKLCEAK
jgi:hypothetical protein